ncbi:UPF0415 protein C7orf25 homolog isoform X1 [Eupeodes corollae]|uniref:UPF0415 protein C7orf25 homolog isoform X1 n=2 Tax=Eupeodes corollae TaxID=290404 RepID=UPI002493039D|nr:UPF0415 protein C7orf25 homolog isoform X1 [Eupeodes corollae]
MEICEENIKKLAEEKIFLGKNLIEQLDQYKTIPGAQKIQRKINQEIKFLQKVVSTNSIKLNHVMCSNLTHYQFLVKILELQKDVVHIDCGFPVEERNNPLRVDIVCENGLKWIKAIARNSKSLTDAANGRASYGAKSIIDQAEEFIYAANQNLCMFRKPKVVFYFSHEIENEILEDMKEIGVEALSITNQQPLPGDVGVLNDEDNSETDYADVSTLNLDITTMLAYISSLTNGSTNWSFREPILTEQAKRERESPLKPVLDKIFEGKRLICCETAFQSFQDIVNLLAGDMEKQRAKELMERVEIHKDVQEIPNEVSVINVGGKINPRSLKIFAFGITMKALTITSNKGFIRSAKMQGINVPVFIHQARALTESKETTAQRL